MFRLVSNKLPRAASIAVLCLAGCGPETNQKFDPTTDFEVFKAQLEYNLERNRTPMEIIESKVHEVVDVTPEVVKLQFTVTAKYFQNTFIEINRNAVLQRAGWDEQAVQAAARKLRGLPPADAEAGEKLNPLPLLPPGFFRSEGEQGAERHFEGTCLARRRGTKWAFENYEVRPTDSTSDSLDVGAVLMTNLPPKSLNYSTSHGKQTITDAVAKSKLFIAAAAATEKSVLEREERLFEALQKFVEQGKTWVCSVPDEGKIPISWLVEVVANENDGEKVRVLVRHPTDENRRRMFAGKIQRAVVEDLGPYERPKRHPPEVALLPSGAGPSMFYAGDEKLHIRAAADGASPHLYANTKNAPLTPGTSNRPPLTEDEAHAELLRRLEPGMQWNGSVTTHTGHYENVTFTVTQRKEDGSYLRVVAESGNNPLTMVVFEGTFDKSHVHGWPIVMRATHSEIGETKLSSFFRSDMETHPPLILSLHEEGFVGTRGSDKIFLSSTRRLNPWSPRSDALQQLFSAGARFRGRAELDKKSTDVTLTIAEVRNDGDYVRAVLQRSNEPQEMAVYEGRLRKEPEYVDGYAVELFKRQSGTSQGNLFDRTTNIVISLRLALDNSAILGIVHRPGERFLETMRLTRQPTKAEGVSMATSDFADLIRGKLIKGAYFRGTGKDLTNKRTYEATLRIVEASGDGVTVELTSNRSGGGKAVYEGMLRLDDTTVNGYCLVLEKNQGIKPPTSRNSNLSSVARVAVSEIFDEVVGKSRLLRFALSYDGEALLGITESGMAIDGETGEMTSGELLALRSVATTKPPSLRMVPIAAAPNMPVLEPGNFRAMKDVLGKGGNSGSASTSAPTGPATVATTTNVAAPSSSRTWRSSNGKFSIEATLIAFKDGTVELKRADGQIVKVPVDQLSAEDREFAQQFKGGQ